MSLYLGCPIWGLKGWVGNFFKKRKNEIWMLTIYDKSEMENIPAHILRQIAEEVKNV